jgi:hypothetical protein
MGSQKNNVPNHQPDENGPCIDHLPIDNGEFPQHTVKVYWISPFSKSTNQWLVRT